MICIDLLTKICDKQIIVFKIYEINLEYYDIFNMY